MDLMDALKLLKKRKNLAESIEYFIKVIIKNLEEINSKGGEGINNRQSVALDSNKYNKYADSKTV